MNALWTIAANPRKRRSKKSRSPAQRAATRRMIAANRSVKRNPTKRRARRSSPVASAPRRSPSRRSTSRVRASFAGSGASAMTLVKAGAIGAGGALAVDVAQGFVNGFLPVSMATKLNADGTTNYLNYAVKGALAVGLAHFGKRFLPGGVAAQMATGSMTVMAYELMRPLAASMLPASMPLGWYNPATTYKVGSVPGVSGQIGNYQNVAGLRSAGAYMRSGSNVSSLQSPNAGQRVMGR
jgi:hypothetical protein